MVVAGTVVLLALLVTPSAVLASNDMGHRVLDGTPVKISFRDLTARFSKAPNWIRTEEWNPTDLWVIPAVVWLKTGAKRDTRIMLSITSTTGIRRRSHQMYRYQSYRSIMTLTRRLDFLAVASLVLVTGAMGCASSVADTATQGGGLESDSTLTVNTATPHIAASESKIGGKSLAQGRQFAFGRELHHYETLAHMVSSSDLIAVGVVTAVRKGRWTGLDSGAPIQAREVEVKPLRILKGSESIEKILLEEDGYEESGVPFQLTVRSGRRSATAS